jgi:ribonuclease P protein component
LQENKLGKNRLGITVGTKVGNAVVRNKDLREE